MLYSRALSRLRSWMRRSARPSCNHATAGNSYDLRTHMCGELSRDHVGQSVTLCGWLRKPSILEAQGIAFLPVHDTTGTTQFVCDLNAWQDVLNSFKTQERVVKLVGVVRPRPSEAVNPNLPTGEVEVELKSLEVLNDTTHHPFSTFGHVDSNISVEQQLRERQVYLRLPHMQKNIRLRSKVAMALREALVDRHNFIEIETPTLARMTAGGAEEFVVPAQTKGQFFSLVQSPQQFKQLLMVSGFDRYFQLARCYRNESQRADRQLEFTQVDLEMSFADSECVMGLTEDILQSTITSLCPQFSLPTSPFPRMKYKQAMELYGSDKPDTRYELTLQNLSFLWQEQLQGIGLDSGPFCPYIYGVRIPQWRQALKELKRSGGVKDISKRINAISRMYPTALLDNDTSKDSLEVLLDSLLPAALRDIFAKSSPSIAENFAEKVKEYLSWQDGDLCVVASSEHEKDKMLTALGAWRTLAASILSHSKRLELDSTQLNFLWVTDFPLFTVLEKKRGVYRVESTHHPFTAPLVEHRDMLEGMPALGTLAQVCGQHYDIVVNGVELGGGSIRIHDPDLQEHIITNILQIPSDDFSHMLKGLRSGCPPHGGIALGFDRLMALLCQANSLRDVIAFPKSFYGRDLLTGAPTELPSGVASSYHHTDHKDLHCEVDKQQDMN